MGTDTLLQRRIINSLFTRKKGRKVGLNSIYLIKTTENKQIKQQKTNENKQKTNKKQTNQNINNQF